MNPGSNLDFNSMTADDIRANMKIVEDNKMKGAADFMPTQQFYTDADNDKPVLAVDENHGWFMNTAKDDGWV